MFDGFVATRPGALPRFLKLSPETQPVRTEIVFPKLTAVIRKITGLNRNESVERSDRGTSHLRYDSVEAWMAGENVPPGFISEPDPVLRDQYIRQFGELRRHLYAEHVATLSPETRRAIEAGLHPSQSHRLAEEAQRQCEPLRHHLIELGWNVSEVCLGHYHMDRTVLTVAISEPLDAVRRSGLPQFFEGYEIMYL